MKEHNLYRYDLEDLKATKMAENVVEVLGKYKGDIITYYGRNIFSDGYYLNSALLCAYIITHDKLGWLDFVTYSAINENGTVWVAWTGSCSTIRIIMCTAVRRKKKANRKDPLF